MQLSYYKYSSRNCITGYAVRQSSSRTDRITRSMAGFSFIGDLAKKAESGAAQITSQATGAVANTAHAFAGGVAAVPKILGFRVQKGSVDGAAVPLEKVQRPAAAVLGEIQYAEQIDSILDEVDVLILGGDLIYAFYKVQGYSVGSTQVTDEDLELAKSILEKAKAKGVRVVLPKEVVVADSDPDYLNTKIVAASEIPEGWSGADVAPSTVELVGDALNGVKTIIIDAPGMGAYDEATAKGIAKKVEEAEEKGATVFSLTTSSSLPAAEGAEFDDKDD